MFQSITLTPTFAVKQSGKRNGPKMFYAAWRIAPDTNTGCAEGIVPSGSRPRRLVELGVPWPRAKYGVLLGGHFYKLHSG